MFVAASTHCFSDDTFTAACQQLADLGYDKIEIWLDEAGEHLKPSEIADDMEGFSSRYRDTTRLTPAALCLAHDVEPAVFVGLSKAAKHLRITQITVPAAPLGTPFNSEVDRLKEFCNLAGTDGVRVSIETKTGQLTEDPHTAVELCQAVKGLGLTLDPSYYLCGPNRGAPYDQVFPYVYHLHLRDTSPDQVQVQVGLGEIDYSRLISQLGRNRYAGALSVDLHPELLGETDRALELRKIRMLLESLL